MLITKKEAVAEANRWLKEERKIQGIEVVDYSEQEGGSLAWDINIKAGDKRFNELSSELEEHMNLWVKKIRKEREG